jgi:hypothetical protein
MDLSRHDWDTFTYGVDVVLLVGRLRLVEHQAVNEIHHELHKQEGRERK